MSDVVLRVDGRDYEGWKSVTVSRALEVLAGKFQLELTDPWNPNHALSPLAENRSCTVTLDGLPVLSGVIDVVAPNYDRRTHTVRVSGRSMPGQLSDCACELPTGGLRGQTLAGIARRLAEPFGVDVLDLAEASERFDRVQVEPGETVYETLERLARQRGVFLTDNAEGQLVIRRRSNALQGALTLGSNILLAQAEFDGSEQFSNYTVRGQREGSDTTQPGVTVGSAGRAVDASVPIHRPKIILAETTGSSLTFKERAEFEAGVRRGRSRRWMYTVNGWQRPDGELWTVAEEIEVTDAFMRLDQERLLVIEARFSFDSRGRITELTVAPPEGYDLVAEREGTNRVATAEAKVGWDAL